MKELKRDLQAVLKGLKALQQKAERMTKKIEKLEKASAPKKAKPTKAKPKKAKKKVTKKAPRITATDAILAIVKRSKKGVSTAAMRQKTGFNDAKVRSIVFRLKKQGKIKNAGKGVYLKA